MNDATTTDRPRPVAILRRFATPSAAVEHCDLCNIPLAPRHRHLLETGQRRIVCSCDACALRFHDVIDGRYQLIPRSARALTEFVLTDADWDGLALPINLVFFFRTRANDRVITLYPSPAGVTESLLPLTTWQTLVADNPVLATMQPDVEALLVNRVREARQYYLAPIDACFELAGLIRLHWRGLSGGETVWREINRFFQRLEAGRG